MCIQQILKDDKWLLQIRIVKVLSVAITVVSIAIIEYHTELLVSHGL